MLFADDTLTTMGHDQTKADLNLGLGWLYYAIARLVRPHVAVVIGSWRGFSPLVIAKALNDNGGSGKLVFVDPSFVDGFWKDPQRVMTTQQFVESERYQALDSVDLVFVDGYHTYAQARYDVAAFEPKLSDRGFLLLHDSVSFELSTVYGFQNMYVQQVALLVDELRQRGDLSVLEVPYGDGLSIVTKRRRGAVDRAVSRDPCRPTL